VTFAYFFYEQFYLHGKMNGPIYNITASDELVHGSPSSALYVKRKSCSHISGSVTLIQGMDMLLGDSETICTHCAVPLNIFQIMVECSCCDDDFYIAHCAIHLDMINIVWHPFVVKGLHIY
jgi:hypothetical protein